MKKITTLIAALILTGCSTMRGSDYVPLVDRPGRYFRCE